MQSKVVISNKVDKLSDKKFKIKKDKKYEIDLTVEIVEEGDYIVEKLSVDGLPEVMNDGKAIQWFNNFAIKKGGQYINQRYFVTVPGLGSSPVVIFDGNGDPYYYTGQVTNDTFELTDGDPAVGKT